MEVLQSLFSHLVIFYSKVKQSEQEQEEVSTSRWCKHAEQV